MVALAIDSGPVCSIFQKTHSAYIQEPDTKNYMQNASYVGLVHNHTPACAHKKDAKTDLKQCVVI